MKYKEEYWKPVEERYKFSGNSELHDLINNIAFPYDKSKLASYYENVSEEDQQKDKEIIELISKLRKYCKDADADESQYTPRIRDNFVKLMKLMDERGWENLPNTQSTKVVQQRRVMKKNLSYYQFLILQYLAAHKDESLTHRQISDDLMISNTLIMREMENIYQAGLVDHDAHLTDAGLDALAPYKVKRAVILAAGFGSRMMPATADRPKPMVKVNGRYIVSTLIDALMSAGVTDITIIRGYKKDKFNELLKLYPNIHFIDNDVYDQYNNISSAVLAKDIFKDGCYLCEADLYISNPGIITPYQYRSNILGSWSIETDDWNFKMDDEGMISHYQKGNTYCWNYYGISYWTPEDCEKLNHDWAEIFATEEGKDVFWEQVPLQLRQNEYRVAVRPCRKQDIMEIDNYYELQQLDQSYKDVSTEAGTAPSEIKQS